MTKTYKKDEVELARVPYIHYPIWFKKDKNWALINSSNKVNTMTFVYAAQLGLKVLKTNVVTQKIDSSVFQIFRVILQAFE